MFVPVETQAWNFSKCLLMHNKKWDHVLTKACWTKLIPVKRRVTNAWHFCEKKSQHGLFVCEIGLEIVFEFPFGGANNDQLSKGMTAIFHDLYVERKISIRSMSESTWSDTNMFYHLSTKQTHTHASITHTHIHTRTHPSTCTHTYTYYTIRRRQQKSNNRRLIQYETYKLTHSFRWLFLRHVSHKIKHSI